MDVRGKGAFVTGGARGIGRAITEALLEKGAKVLFCDINEDLGKATEIELQKKSRNAFFAVCDVSDESQLSAAFQEAISKFGAVEIFINNAGILNENAMDQCVAINQLATMKGTLLAEQHMRKDKGGRGGAVVNVSSVLGMFVAPQAPVYTATKHAVLGFTMAIAHRQLDGDSGVRVMVICPGTVNTEMMCSNEKILFNIKDQTDLDRAMYMNPSEIGACVAMLAEEGENGSVLEILKAGKPQFRRRAVVDKAGGGNPMYPDDLLIPQLAAIVS